MMGDCYLNLIFVISIITCEITKMLGVEYVIHIIDYVIDYVTFYKYKGDN